MTIEEYLKQHERIVHHYLNNIAVSKNDYDDYVQIGLMGLCRAYDTYNEEHNCKPSTWAYNNVRWAILRHIDRHSNEDILCDPHEFDVMSNESSDSLQDYISSNFSDTEVDIINMRMMGYTYEQIGKKHHMNRQAVSKMYKDTILKIQEANA